MNRNINQIIKTSRERQKISQEELAEKLGVSVATIHNWEHGVTTPNVEYLKSMTDILQIEQQQLVRLLTQTQDRPLKFKYPIMTPMKFREFLPDSLCFRLYLPFDNIELTAEELKSLQIIELFNQFQLNPLPELIKAQPDYQALANQLKQLNKHDLITGSFRCVNSSKDISVTSLGRAILSETQQTQSKTFNLNQLSLEDFIMLMRTAYESAFRDMDLSIDHIVDLVKSQRILMTPYDPIVVDHEPWVLTEEGDINCLSKSAKRTPSS